MFASAAKVENAVSIKYLAAAAAAAVYCYFLGEALGVRGRCS